MGMSELLDDVEDSLSNFNSISDYDISSPAKQMVEVDLVTEALVSTLTLCCILDSSMPSFTTFGGIVSYITRINSKYLLKLNVRSLMVFENLTMKPVRKNVNDNLVSYARSLQSSVRQSLIFLIDGYLHGGPFKEDAGKLLLPHKDYVSYSRYILRTLPFR